MTTFTEKFVSVAGSGANTGADVSNEWTMAQATANAAAGFRMNCKAGTYVADDSISSAVMDLDVAGTVGNWIEWRAYTTTIGDFTPGEAQPVIIDAGTNALTNAMIATTIASNAYNRFIGMEFSGASSHGVNGGATVDNMAFIGSKFSNNGGRGVQGDNLYGFLVCEFTNNTTNAMDVDNDLRMQACKIHNENLSTGVVSQGNSATYINNLIYDVSNGTYFRFTTIPVFSGNTLDGENGASSKGVEFSGGTIIPSLLTNNIFFDFDVGVNFATGGVEEALIRGFNYFSSCNTNYDGIVDETTDIDDGTTDPFTDSASRDYTLASGSNAIGAGADAGNFA